MFPRSKLSVKDRSIFIMMPSWGTLYVFCNNKSHNYRLMFQWNNLSVEDQ